MRLEYILRIYLGFIKIKITLLVLQNNKKQTHRLINLFILSKENLLNLY